MTCTECPHAIWDYEEYYGTTQKQWFVDGCKIGKDPEECEKEDECLMCGGDCEIDPKDRRCNKEGY